MLPRESRVFNKVEPATQWGWQETFLNKAVYYLEVLAWQNATPHERGKKAEHMQNKPQLYRPDFMPKPESSIQKGIMAADVDTIKELLSRKRG